MRHELTEKIVRIKLERDSPGPPWPHWPHRCRRSFVTAALLGQMTLPGPAAHAIGHFLGLDTSEIKLLQQPPWRGCMPGAVPTDPLVYRFYELVSVYGTTFKALIMRSSATGS